MKRKRKMGHFKREAHLNLILALAVPVLALLAALIVPWIVRLLR